MSGGAEDGLEPERSQRGPGSRWSRQVESRSRWIRARPPSSAGT